MSKIQKALQAMRGAQTAEDAARKKAKKFVAQHGANTAPSKRRDGAADRRHGGPVSHDRSPADLVSELSVAQRVTVDMEALRESGLYPEGAYAEVVGEQFRRAKRPVLHVAFDAGVPIGENANVVMVTSAMPGAGKSFCSFNLAQSIALEQDVGAVLVDADVLKPNISRSLGLENRPGLIDFLLDREMSLESILVETDLDGMVVVPAGKRHSESSELLSSRRMKQLVTELGRRFSHRAVVFDTPPILVTNEAHVLAKHMGQIVFIIEARESSQESVLQALGSLDRDMPINAILNKSRSAAGSGYHGDDYGYYPFYGGRAEDVDRVRE